MAGKKSMSHRSRLVRPGRAGLRWPDPPVAPRPSSTDAVPAPAGARIAWLPTLLAKGAGPLRAEHLRHVRHAVEPARLHLIVLDTSGSMRRRGGLALAKGHAAALIERAARAGDRVALLCFGGQGVELRLPPGPARASGREKVRPLGGGGGTPVTHALAEADRLLRRAERREGPVESWLWLLTDGRTLERPAAPAAARHVVVVDFDDPARALGRCADWARGWGAEHHRARS
ncbi:magnesium chelatase subunit ChlD-like protein [Variovorax sp. PvP013]